MPTTNFVETYRRSRFLDEITYYVPYYDEQVIELDPFTPYIHEFISRLTVFTSVTYMGEQLTTLCHRYHGTTTTRWIVLMVNGLMSQTELRNGMNLQVPTVENMQEVTNQLLREKIANVQSFGSTILD